jgi:hypothetical protein
VDPDLVNLEDASPAEQRYSFVFDGNAQTLDHALVTQNMAPLVAAFARGRGNADSADTLRNDPTRQLAVRPAARYFTCRRRRRRCSLAQPFGVRQAVIPRPRSPQAEPSHDGQRGLQDGAQTLIRSR